MQKPCLHRGVPPGVARSFFSTFGILNFETKFFLIVSLAKIIFFVLKCESSGINILVIPLFSRRERFRLGGKRGAGVPGAGSRGTGSRGVENAESGGKRGVRWKTRGPVENAGTGGKRGV